MTASIMVSRQRHLSAKLQGPMFAAGEPGAAVGCSVQDPPSLPDSNTNLKQAEMRNNNLAKDGDARKLSREERKMMAIMRQIEEMEHKEKVKAGRVRHGNASTSLAKGSSGGSMSSPSCHAITVDYAVNAQGDTEVWPGINGRLMHARMFLWYVLLSIVLHADTQSLESRLRRWEQQHSKR
jgi:hypothetical protein